ncbi:T9SS type A sorting domain-containing protein [Flavobacteriales bacterium]|nr:T9SS type A sorting domain-containing protein [Flavobacteriales bacterium]
MKNSHIFLVAILCATAFVSVQSQETHYCAAAQRLLVAEENDGQQLLVQSAAFCECENFEEGNNQNWPHVVTACTADDGNMGEAQSFEIVITALPEEGATYRVAKTVSNGNWDVSSETALELGVNSKVVGEVSFARAVKFQFSDCNIEYSIFSVNDAEICGSTAVVLGCTNETACNYNPDATQDDESCFSVGDACDDGDDLTVDDAIDENCECVGQGDPAGLVHLDMEFQMGPNPASQSILLSASAPIERILVMNSTGAVVLQRTSMRSAFELNLEGVSDGVYVIKCYIGEEWVTRRMVVSQVR